MKCLPNPHSYTVHRWKPNQFMKMSSIRPNGGRKAANNRPPSGKKQPDVTQQLLYKEEEYMRLNAEIEEKTASLIREAEEVMHDQDTMFSRPDTTTSPGISSADDIRDFLSSMELSPGSALEQASSPATQNRPGSRNQKRPKSKSGVERQKSGISKSRVKNNQQVDTTTFKVSDVLAERINLATTICGLEDDAKDESCVTTSTFTEDILPTGADDMGSEATIRFLKAKLNVMQEEMDRLSTECSKKDDNLKSVQSKTKELTEEQVRLQKINNTLQSQIEKYKTLYAESKSKTNSLEALLSSTQKELDGVQREQKQFASNKSVIEVRLNRALEEVEKYKTALHKAKSTSKDSSDQERRRLDQLLAENKRLEKQKNELMAGFKKQMKLIDILKRQKMHVEAAKLLQFSEEEFVKALDWGN